MTTRLRIDLSAGSIEVEGEEKFVQQIYQDFRERIKPAAPTPTEVFPHPAKAEPTRIQTSRADLAAFESLSELLAAAGPNSDPERALVACAHYQSKNDLNEFDSQSVNKELKHTGHTVANITDALESNIAHDPKLIIQLRKSGTTRQARKKYKVTDEGFAQVVRMTAPSTENPG